MELKYALGKIDRNGIGRPSCDGSRGGDLYKVTFDISGGTPPDEWCEMFRSNWDRPTSWTTTHDPRIAFVCGSQIVLTLTTLERVSQSQKAMLEQVIAKTNQDYEDLCKKAEMERAEQASIASEWKERTTKLVDEINRSYS